MNVYSSDFMEISYDANKSLMVFCWHNTTENMAVDRFKYEIEKSAEYLSKYKIDYIIVDNQDFHYAITPDLQLWTNELLGPKYAQSGVKRFAIITSEDFIAQLSTEQTVEEEQERSHEVRFCTSQDEAHKWFGLL